MWFHWELRDIPFLDRKQLLPLCGLITVAEKQQQHTQLNFGLCTLQDVNIKINVYKKVQGHRLRLDHNLISYMLCLQRPSSGCCVIFCRLESCIDLLMWRYNIPLSGQIKNNFHHTETWYVAGTHQTFPSSFWKTKNDKWKFEKH